MYFIALFNILILLWIQRNLDTKIWDALKAGKSNCWSARNTWRKEEA